MKNHFIPLLFIATFLNVSARSWGQQSFMIEGSITIGNNLTAAQNGDIRYNNHQLEGYINGSWLRLGQKMPVDNTNTSSSIQENTGLAKSKKAKMPSNVSLLKLEEANKN